MSPPPPLIPPNNTLKLKARLISSQRQTRCSQWAVIGLCLYIFLRHIISATHLYLACMLLASSKLTFLHFLHTMRIEDVTKSFLTITWKGLNRYSPSRICSWMREKRIHDILSLFYINNIKSWSLSTWRGARAVSALCKPRASLCHPELALCRDSPCLSPIHILDHMFMRATEGFLVSVARIFQSNFPTQPPSYTQLGLATWIIGPPPLSSPRRLIRSIPSSETAWIICYG